MKHSGQNTPRRVRLTTPVAIVLCLVLLALLIPFNMGGCGGVSDIGSGMSSVLGGNHPADSSNPPSNGGGGVTNALNNVHTGNSTLDKVGLGNAASGGWQFGKAFFTDQSAEANLGRNVVLQVTGRYGVVNDPALLRYVTFVGMTVADASPNNDFPYCFTVLNTDGVNAFSGPGGFVMITRGSLLRMQDESELAGVLGHEIGHINKHHGLAAVKRAGEAGAFLTAAKNYTGQFTGASDFLGNLILNVGFSQPEELEADAEGVKYAAAAGYSPEGYLHFLQRMAPEQSGKGGPFPTHPGVNTRVAKVADLIARSNVAGKGQTNRERFVANVLQPLGVNR